MFWLHRELCVDRQWSIGDRSLSGIFIWQLMGLDTDAPINPWPGSCWLIVNDWIINLNDMIVYGGHRQWFDRRGFDFYRILDQTWSIEWAKDYISAMIWWRTGSIQGCWTQRPSGSYSFAWLHVIIGSEKDLIFIRPLAKANKFFNPLLIRD